ncbi:MAG: 3-keto-5-aminohexanoate cleavage protein, partial [Pseudomonadota bacterium]
RGQSGTGSQEIGCLMDAMIVNLAPTGMVPTKAMNLHVPISVTEIIDDAKKCIALGANMLHLHARDENGQPSYKRDIYARIIGGIREVHPDVIICVSLSGRNFSDYDKRTDPLNLTGDLKPDMGSLTLSSMNFSQSASVNSPDMIRRLAERMAEAEIKPELEVFDFGMINYANYLHEKGLIKPPFYFNLILGNVASAQATPAQLGLMLCQLPAQSYWTGGGVGAAQLPMNTMGLLYGNGVRTGLEDHLWMDAARSQCASNAAMVQRIGKLATLLDKRIATPSEVRAALGLRSNG